MEQLGVINCGPSRGTGRGIAGTSPAQRRRRRRDRWPPHPAPSPGPRRSKHARGRGLHNHRSHHPARGRHQTQPAACHPGRNSPCGRPARPQPHRKTRNPRAAHSPRRARLPAQGPLRRTRTVRPNPPPQGHNTPATDGQPGLAPSPTAPDKTRPPAEEQRPAPPVSRKRHPHRVNHPSDRQANSRPPQPQKPSRRLLPGRKSATASWSGGPATDPADPRAREIRPHRQREADPPGRP